MVNGPQGRELTQTCVHALTGAQQQCMLRLLSF